MWPGRSLPLPQGSVREITNFCRQRKGKKREWAKSVCVFTFVHVYIFEEVFTGLVKCFTVCLLTIDRFGANDTCASPPTAITAYSNSCSKSTLGCRLHDYWMKPQHEKYSDSNKHLGDKRMFPSFTSHRPLLQIRAVKGRGLPTFMFDTESSSAFSVKEAEGLQIWGMCALAQ